MLPAPKMQMRSIGPCMLESLSDAEARENPAKQLVGADLARDLAERLLRVRELLRDEFSAPALEQQPLGLLHILPRPAARRGARPRRRPAPPARRRPPPGARPAPARLLPHAREPGVVLRDAAAGRTV